MYVFVHIYICIETQYVSVQMRQFLFFFFYLDSRKPLFKFSVRFSGETSRVFWRKARFSAIEGVRARLLINSIQLGRARTKPVNPQTRPMLIAGGFQRTAPPSDPLKSIWPYGMYLCSLICLRATCCCAPPPLIPCLSTRIYPSVSLPRAIRNISVAVSAHIGLADLSSPGLARRPEQLPHRNRLCPYTQ